MTHAAQLLKIRTRSNIAAAAKLCSLMLLLIVAATAAATALFVDSFRLK